ncbi:PucR family transcriptional regulator, partial [Mycobacterium sp. CBMA361]|nr:PucR family transcriptional regulator [Mycolicibacterium sp. CBMA 361]
MDTEVARWQSPSPRVRDLIRSAARGMHQYSIEIAHEMWAAGQRSLESDALVEDPMLSEADRIFTETTLAHWLIANIDDPGHRVTPTITADLGHYARDLALRGLDVSEVEPWRASQRVWWAAWLRFCFDTTANKQELRELVE